MKVAIIDCGTNTFNLLIVEKREIGYKKLFKNKIAVKLGQGGISKKIIATDAFQRGVEAIEQHLEKIKEHGVLQTLAFATSAIRSTENGWKFVDEIKRKYQLEIQVIDGNKEAELIYHGVKQAIDLGQSNKLIMDIGGGSTEFIIANKNEIFWKQSFQLGVSRLLEKFKPSDPITEENIQEIERFLDQTLEPLFTALNKHGSKTLIGSSGSFDTIAEMIAHKFYSIEILKGKKKYKFQLDDYQWAHQYLLDSDIEKRLSTAGIISMRADMIVLSSIFIQYIITRVKIKKMKLSTYALKEGALDQFFATTS